MSRCFGDFYAHQPVTKESLEKARVRKLSKNWDEPFKNPKQYVDFKLDMLRIDMCIHPTSEEVAHLNTLKTETAIDNAVHSIIARHWSDF